jgi:two-component system, sensor histidine kinase
MARKASTSAGRAKARAKPRRLTGRSDSIALALASLAHEIRTPLNGILALAELLAASDLPERERGWVAALQSAGDHLARFTTLAVDGARARTQALPLARKTFDPRAFTRDLGASLAARAAANGLIATVRIAENLPQSVIGDPVRVRAVLENLLDNAVKFTPRGRVAFAASAAPAGDPRIRLVFTVEDEGIGLSKAEVGRLFRPYAQASREIGRRFGGAGLGLSLARHIARAMGGDVTVRSTPGKGSAFRLAIVVDKAADAAVARRPPRRRLAGTARPARVDRPLHILGVEDNPYGRVVLRAIASALGHGIEFVGSGEAALAAVRERRHDLVLMDLVLPGIDGLAAARRIRALRGRAGTIPIVGISGRGGAGDEAAARAAGIDRYLVKPVSPNALADAIGAVMRG